MDLNELIQRRQSDRKYSPDAVNKEQIEKCLEAARLAPSACNSQSWHFVVINDNTLLKSVTEAAAGLDYCMLDVGIAVEHFCLQAT